MTNQNTFPIKKKSPALTAAAVFYIILSGFGLCSVISCLMTGLYPSALIAVLLLGVSLTLGVTLLVKRRPTKLITAMLFAYSAYYLIAGTANLIYSFGDTATDAAYASMKYSYLASAVNSFFACIAYLLLALMALLAMRTPDRDERPLNKLWLLPSLLTLLGGISTAIGTYTMINEMLAIDVDPAIRSFVTVIMFISLGIGSLIGIGISCTPVLLLSKWLRSYKE